MVGVVIVGGWGYERRGDGGVVDFRRSLATRHVDRRRPEVEPDVPRWCVARPVVRRVVEGSSFRTEEECRRRIDVRVQAAQGVRSRDQRDMRWRRRRRRGVVVGWVRSDSVAEEGRVVRRILGGPDADRKQWSLDRAVKEEDKEASVVARGEGRSRSSAKGTGGIKENNRAMAGSEQK